MVLFVKYQMYYILEDVVCSAVELYCVELKHVCEVIYIE